MDVLLVGTLAELISDHQLNDLAHSFAQADQPEDRQLALAFTICRILSERQSARFDSRSLILLTSSHLCRALLTFTQSELELVNGIETIALACPSVTEQLVADLCRILEIPLLSLPQNKGELKTTDCVSNRLGTRIPLFPAPGFVVPSWLQNDALDWDIAVGRCFLLLTRLCGPASSLHRVPQYLIEFALSFLGSANAEIVGRARQFLCESIRSLEAEVLKLQTAATDPLAGLSSLDQLEPVIWDHTSILLEHSPEHCRTAALAVWLRFLTTGCPSLRLRLRHASYWSCLQGSLLDGSDPRRKYALAILALSFPDEREKRTAFERFCTVYEAVVLGRYFNQAQEAIALFDGLFESSYIQDWAWVLLIAALGSGVQERHRTAVGCWCLTSGDKLASLFLLDSEIRSAGRGGDNGFTALPLRFLLTAFIPWAAQGYLFLDSVEMIDHLPVCRHGNEIIAFFNSLLSCVEDIVAEKIILVVLDRINWADNRLFPQSLPFLITPLANAVVKMPASQTGHLLESYRPLRSEPGLSPAGRRVMTYFDSLFENLRPHTDSALTHQPLSSCSKPRKIPSSFEEHWKEIQQSQHASIRGLGLEVSCTDLIALLAVHSGPIQSFDIVYQSINALWVQFEIEEYPKEVVQIIELILHPKVTQAALECSRLGTLVRTAILKFADLSRSRLRFFNYLTIHLRKLFFHQPKQFVATGCLGLILDIINNPPTLQRDSLLELAISLLPYSLEHHQPENVIDPREECNYERMGFTRLFDILNRMSVLDPEVVHELLHSILAPWLKQQQPIPADSLRRKRTLQLQAAFILVEVMGEALPKKQVLSWLVHLLRIEPMPKFRMLLEWIYVRVVHASPALAFDLYHLFLQSFRLSNENPRFVTSLIRILTAAAHFKSAQEDLIHDFMADLIAGSMSTKVSIRYESQWALLVLLGCAEEQGWASITANPILSSAKTYLRSLVASLDGKTPAHVAMTKKFGDCNLKNLFEGPFLNAQPVEPTLVRQSDFEVLEREENFGQGLAAFPRSVLSAPPTRAKTGPTGAEFQSHVSTAQTDCFPEIPCTGVSSRSRTGDVGGQSCLQTKGTAWKTLLSSHADSALALTVRSSSKVRNQNLILLGSLLTSPTNIGGLCRCAEVLGVGMLYVDSRSVLSSPAFQAVAVTSELHLPISECSRDTSAILTLLDGFRKDGYQAVGIEQTESSVVLGSPECILPQRVVFILGNEHTGIPADLLAHMDRCVEIRQTGVIRSLNVQTAGAVVLAEYARQYPSNQ